MGEYSKTPAEHIADAEGLLRGSNTTQEHFDRVVAGFEERLTVDERYALMTRLEQQSQGAQTSALIAIAKLLGPAVETITAKPAMIHLANSRTCGVTWSWREKSETAVAGTQHFEICTEPMRHTGAHFNQVTNVRGVADEPTKTSADQLHELVSYGKEAAAANRTIEYPAGDVADAYEDLAGKLEAILMEGGL